MATRLYLGSSPVPTWMWAFFRARKDGTTAAWRQAGLGTSKGSGTLARSVATVAGPTNGIEFLATSSPSPTEYFFVSPPLAQAVTISGTISFNLWAREDAAATNAQLRVIVERLSFYEPWFFDNPDAVVIDSSEGVELDTTIAARAWTGSPTSTDFAIRDRIAVTVLVDDAPAVNMAVGTAFLNYGGTTDAADGDTWLEFAETLTFLGPESTPGGDQLFLRSDFKRFGTGMTFGSSPSCINTSQECIRDFNEADTSTFTGNVTKIGTGPEIVSNALKNPTNGTGWIYSNLNSAEFFTAAVIGATSGSQTFDIIYEAKPTSRSGDPTDPVSWSGYYCRFDPNAGTATINAYNGTSPTQLAQITGLTLSAGDEVAVSKWGGIHRVYLKPSGGAWTQINPTDVYDNTYFEGGRQGWRINGANLTIDSVHQGGQGTAWPAGSSYAPLVYSLSKSRGASAGMRYDNDNWPENGPQSPQPVTMAWEWDILEDRDMPAGMWFLRLRARHAVNGSGYQFSYRAGVVVKDSSGTTIAVLGGGSRTQTINSTTEGNYDLWMGCKGWSFVVGDKLGVYVKIDDIENATYFVGGFPGLGVNGPTPGGTGDSYLITAESLTPPITDEAPLRQGVTPLRWR